MSKLREHAAKLSLVRSVFVDYANVLAPAMHDAFCVLAFYVGLSIRLQGLVNRSFVVHGPDGFIRVNMVVFHNSALGLRSLEGPIAAGFE